MSNDVSRRRALLLSLGGALGLALPTALIASEEAEPRQQLRPPLLGPPPPPKPPPLGPPEGNAASTGAARAISDVRRGAHISPPHPRLRLNRSNCRRKSSQGMSGAMAPALLGR